MKRFVFVIVLVLLVVAGALYVMTLGGPPPDGMAPPDKIVAKSSDGTDKGTRRTLVPSKIGGGDDDGAGDDGEAAPRPFRMKVEKEAPLSGLSVHPSTPDERKVAGVSEKFGTGVTITEIHPDAPAAEVAMEPGDVIVRAETENVNTEADLRRVTAERDHVVITFARKGQLLQVVLQQPFDPALRRAP